MSLNFEPSDDTDVINKAYPDKNFSKIQILLVIIETDLNVFILLSNKQSVEEIQIQRAVKATIQGLFDKGLFNKYEKADGVLKGYYFVGRRRANLEEVICVIQ